MPSEINERLGVDPKAYSGVPALRREARSPKRDDCENATGLKRGDLLEIVLIQTKGGSAPPPTAEDVDRLSRVARHHRAKAVVLAEWRRGEKLASFRLEERKWQSVTPAAIFG